MKAFLSAVLVAAVAVPAGVRADVRCEFSNGKVTLEARDATVRQILTEWARVGQTTIVNLERVGSGPVTLQLSGMPERQALDIILRSVSGYLAAPRPAPRAGTSAYDRILILATSTAAPAQRTQTPSYPARTYPGGVPPRVMAPSPGTPELVLPDPVDADEEDAPPGMGAVQPGMMAPPFGQAEPSGGTPVPATPSAPTAEWTVPAGTAAPGVVPATPQRPGAQRVPSGARPPQPDR